MGRLQAERAIKEMLMSGYGHYSRADEHKILKNLLHGDYFDFNSVMINFPLAAQPLRSVKNSLICSVAVMCRYAADLGADDERCYAMSDYYINEIEIRADMNNWQEMITEIYSHYMELVQAAREKQYTLPVRRAVRYIHQHLYDACRLQEVAVAVKVHPGYLSALFKAETGISLTQYVRDKKISEAKTMLREADYSVSEIAEMLGFNSLSYFSKVFRQVSALSPREYAETLYTGNSHISLQQ